jgi:hypothetical protein
MVGKKNHWFIFVRRFIFIRPCRRSPTIARFLSVADLASNSRNVLPPPWPHIAQPVPDGSSPVPPLARVRVPHHGRWSPAPAPGGAPPAGRWTELAGAALAWSPPALPWRSSAAPAPGGGRPCRPGRSSPAQALLGACPRRPRSELPPPSTSRRVTEMDSHGSWRTVGGG